MKSIFSSSLLLALLCGAALSTPAFAHEHDAAGKAQSKSDSPGSVLYANDAGVSADWLAKAKAAYPLSSCVVSGDEFDGGAMGKPQDYVYRQAGKPDQLIRFCCKDCVKDFSKEPGQYLKALDEAATAKATPSK